MSAIAARILRQREEQRAREASPTIDPSWAAANPDAAQALLTRKEFELFRKEFRPLEEQALQRIGDMPGEARRAARKAGGAVLERFAAVEKATPVRLEQQGIRLDADQQRVMQRQRGIERALAFAGARNDARRGVREGNLDMLSAALNIGRGISAGATQGLGQAAAMQNAREMAYRRAKADWQAGVLQSGLMGAGIGAAALGGASGALLGGAGGLLLALL